MRPEFSHWYWYEKLSKEILKNNPLVEFIDQERKNKISDLMKQVAYEIAGGLRARSYGNNSVSSTEEVKPEPVQLNQDAVEKLKKLSL